MANYVNPFGDWREGANAFFNWVHPIGGGTLDDATQETYSGQTGLGALGANLVRSWRTGRANNFSAWLNDNFGRLQNQYNQVASMPGNENLGWLDWLAQRQSNIMSDYATSAPVEQGYRPYDFINLRTRWQR